MGVTIHLDMLPTVEDAEWRRVYEETLSLASAFPLADAGTLTLAETEVECLVPVRERSFAYGRNNEQVWYGWRAIGDLDTLSTAETFVTPRELNRRANGGDPASQGDATAQHDAWEIYLIADRTSSQEGDENTPAQLHLWGAKTQGEPYHMYLLAIGCLIADRLKNKAFLYGDITAGQCRKAVEMANEHLETPIEAPDRCDAERFALRARGLSLSETEQLDAFMRYYLGNCNEDLGNLVRRVFSKAAIAERWTAKFKRSEVASIAFKDTMRECLLLGFSLDDIARFANCDNYDGQQAERFLKCVLDAKLHVKEKDTTDALRINQDDEAPYGIATVFAHMVFRGLQNNGVDRHIPIEEIRRSMQHFLEGKIDVDATIDSYLAQKRELNEGASSDAGIPEGDEKVDGAFVNRMIAAAADKNRQRYEDYDVADFEDLLVYRPGNTVYGPIMKSLGKLREFCEKVLAEDDYEELLARSPYERFEWFARCDGRLGVRDCDWKTIYERIVGASEAFARYYPLARISMSNERIRLMAAAVAINDDVYELMLGAPVSK